MRAGRFACLAVVALAFAAVASTANAAPPTTTVMYDDFEAAGGYTLADYNANWSNPYGLGDMGVAPGDTRSFADGTFAIDDAPFRTSFDFSVFDHLKYIAISNASFAVPEEGSLMFSASIAARTPGTIPGRVVHGTYGPPFSYPNGAPYAARVLEGQQAGAVLNMINFATGQLFDWFVSGSTAFALIERLPSSVTGNTSDPSSPDWAGPNEMYTQIIKELPVTPGVAHRVAIRYTRERTSDHVDFMLDGVRVARVDDVGVPLDRQDVKYTGIYPSLGPGERLRPKLDSFVIGHGTFSLLDAFPFQWGWGFGVSGPFCDPSWPDVCAMSVSIPTSERLFGQGVRARFDDFAVTTHDDAN